LKTILWKKEWFGEVEAGLSVCNMKWVEVEEGKRWKIIRRTKKNYFHLHCKEV